MEIDRIYNMDCLEGMRQMADGSVIIWLVATWLLASAAAALTNQKNQ